MVDTLKKNKWSTFQVLYTPRQRGRSDTFYAIAKREESAPLKLPRQVYSDVGDIKQAFQDTMNATRGEWMLGRALTYCFIEQIFVVEE